jgi:hydrogenase nickel incorporation protein HypA/HybF
MHELGVVFHIIDSVKEIAAENAVTQVASVTLKLGEVSGVIPDYLTDFWNWAVKRTDVLKGAELIIETIPAVTFCEDCRQEYETVRYGRTCPNCGSGNTYLVQGNEFLIKEIAVIDEAEPES